MPYSFVDLLVAVRKDPVMVTQQLCRMRLLAIDPGETTGIALFLNIQPVNQFELKPRQVSGVIEPVASLADQIASTLNRYREIDVIILEDYRVYKWRAKQHTWSDLHTPRLIGAIEYIASKEKIPIIKQPAHVAKQFCTDDKLKHWGMYISGLKHARDAVRHGCYYLLFNKEILKHVPKTVNI